MAVVLALMIVGWLLAFALGAQAGFEPQAEPVESTTPQPKAAPQKSVEAYASSVSPLAQ
jgi:hypothetical protein